MESISTLEIANKLASLELKFVDSVLLSQITGYKNKNTLYKMADRLVDKQVLARLTSGGKFMVTGARPTDFEVANYLYSPSYISLYSALSFYGILPQFTYSVTSVTAKKSKKVVLEEKEFEYSHVEGSLFKGYTNNRGILIATPEKALIDSIYFHSKAIISLDYSELDLSAIDTKLLLELGKELKYGPFQKQFNKLYSS